MKTIFISDLDGTLLKSDKTISKATCETINGLSAEGVSFSYATARSIYSASVLTAGLELRIPVVTKNGTIINNPDKSNLHENVFTKEEAAEIYRILRKYDLDPIVASFQHGEEKYSYDCMRISAGTQSFLDAHVGDVRKLPVEGEEHILDGSVYYFTCIGTKDELWDAYEEVQKKYRSLCTKDTYSDEIWLEIMPRLATKADAIMQLKELYGFDKVVVFGDGVNDVPMFQIADECYAVENAVPELKAIATGIIGNNNEDGVAKWLQDNYKRYL